MLEILHRKSPDDHRFEPSDDVGDDLEEGVVGGQAFVHVQPHIDGGGP